MPLTWNIHTINACREKINACCSQLMFASDTVSNVKPTKGARKYVGSLNSITSSTNTTAQILRYIKSALLANAQGLEEADAKSEKLLEEIFDKYFNQGWNLADILNGDAMFGKDITYNIEHRDDFPMGLMVPSTANDGKEKPLIIFLPGKGGERSTDEWFEQTGVMGTINNSGYENFDGYTACLRSNKYSLDDIKEMVKELSKEYNIDQSNIVLAGYSAGANQALKILSEAEGYFNKGLIISSGAGPTKWLEKIKESGTEVKGIVGKNKKADGAYGYMTECFSNYFDVEVINSGHGDVREKMIEIDDNGNNRSDIYEWAAKDDVNLEKLLNKSNSKNNATKTEKSNSTQPKKTELDKNLKKNKVV